MKDRLIAKMSAGSTDAFEKIMRKYSGYVLAVIRNHSRGVLSREDHEEILIDTFASIWRQRGVIDPERPFMPYLAVTARNKTLGALRSAKLTVGIEDADAHDIDIETQLERKEAVKSIMEVAGQLNDRQRDVFIRFYFYGETLSEISKGLMISSSNARTTLFRARESVKRILSERGYEHV